jgi:hypothetical protein
MTPFPSMKIEARKDVSVDSHYDNYSHKKRISPVQPPMLPKSRQRTTILKKLKI